MASRAHGRPGPRFEVPAAVGRAAVRGVGRGLDLATRPLRRMWRSRQPLDRFGLAHMAGSGGDALVAIGLAGSIFFSVPVGQAKVRVALYLGLTMAPLAVASPLLVPLLDRGGFRRAIAFGASAGRALAALYAAPRLGSLLLFPLAFFLLVLSRVNGVTKNALTMAYAPSREGLVAANARLGRLAVVGGALASLPGLLAFKFGGGGAVLYAAAACYSLAALLTLRLPRPVVPPVREVVTRLGRVPRLTPPAAGTAALRAASGFLFFLLAFALRAGGRPAYWYGLLGAGAAVGGFLGDVLAPRLSRLLEEEAVVFGSVMAAGLGSLVAYVGFDLFLLILFASLAGMATEFGRLSFQSLMQRHAPEGRHGRVFVRYEIAFQLAWVAGAFFPALLPIPFRTGILAMAAFYLAIGVAYMGRWLPGMRRPGLDHGPPA